jgi:hypothetical protein
MRTSGASLRAYPARVPQFIGGGGGGGSGFGDGAGPNVAGALGLVAGFDDVAVLGAGWAEEVGAAVRERWDSDGAGALETPTGSRAPRVVKPGESHAAIKRAKARTRRPSIERWPPAAGAHAR